MSPGPLSPGLGSGAADLTAGGADQNAGGGGDYSPAGHAQPSGSTMGAAGGGAER